MISGYKSFDFEALAFIAEGWLYNWFVELKGCHVHGPPCPSI